MRLVLQLLTGNSAAFLFSLLRNLLLARLLPMTDYGVATTFAIVLAVVDMVAAFGVKQQLVRAREGDLPQFQAALQGFQLLLGLISGGILWLISGGMAAFMGVPEVAWAYQFLALMPVFSALIHLDIHRFNRSMNFGPMLWSNALPAFLALLAVWPLMIWLGDWRVMLVSMLLQSGMAVLVSHVVAERRWRVRFDPAVYAGVLRFGWPLMLNSLLLFLVFQGDKLIVGHELGMATLALFAMGMTLTLTPTLVLNITLQPLFLPRLTQAPDRASFQRLGGLASEAHLLLGAWFAVAVAVLGAPLVDLVLGEKYAALAWLLPLLAVMQAMRLGKGGASTVALACGQTENELYANILRAVLLPVAWILVQQGQGLMTLVWVAMAGEGAGLGVALWLQHHRQGVALRPMLPLLLGWIGTLSAVLAAGIWPEQPIWRLTAVLAALAMAAASNWRGEIRRRRGQLGS